MRLPDGAFAPLGPSPATMEIIEDALDVLGDLLMWRFPLERWARIEPVAARMQEACAAGDEAALRNATADLELMGPDRITRIGDTPVVPPPPRIRERANQLIHSLGGNAAQPPGGSGTDGTDGTDEADAGDTDDTGDTGDTGDSDDIDGSDDRTADR
ncbi:CATRA system-associated protein [Actinomadura sp. 9N215]|uniref:CATRA system-associated protein n=1 Tax=Actinomadura sp. 9N215 TaxID=3375150 RepID=UPI0037A0BDB6